MYKLWGYLAVIGMILSIPEAHARSGATSCPQVMSISALKEIIKSKVDSKVVWAGTTWTLAMNPFGSGELPSNVT